MYGSLTLLRAAHKLLFVSSSIKVSRTSSSSSKRIGIRVSIRVRLCSIEIGPRVSRVQVHNMCTHSFPL